MLFSALLKTCNLKAILSLQVLVSWKNGDSPHLFKSYADLLGQSLGTNQWASITSWPKLRRPGEIIKALLLAIFIKTILRTLLRTVKLLFDHICKPWFKILSYLEFRFQTIQTTGHGGVQPCLLDGTQSVCTPRENNTNTTVSVFQNIHRNSQ